MPTATIQIETRVREWLLKLVFLTARAGWVKVANYLLAHTIRYRIVGAKRWKRMTDLQIEVTDEPVNE